jgi:C1A family cysteine protease
MASRTAGTTGNDGVPTRRTTARYGWVPDLPDARDQVYSAPHVAATKLPPSVDLTPTMPAVYDQGQLGSCTANALGAAFEFDRTKQKLADFMPSRLFNCYNERVIEDSVSTDSGAQIRDGVKTLAKQSTVTSYQRVAQTLSQLKGCLAAGFPIVIGFTVYDSFESDEVARTGVVPMPDLENEHILGGHAVLVVGYDEASQRFRLRNSWGTG